MKLTERIASLLRADAHGVVDALQDSRLVLRQGLREAEMELDRKRARLEALDSEERSRSEELERIAESIRSLDEDVELALAGEKDELARFSLRKLIPLRRESERVKRRLESVQGERGELAGTLEEQERDLETLKARVRARLARVESENDSNPLDGDDAVAEEEVELELLRRRGAAGEAS